MQAVMATNLSTVTLRQKAQLMSSTQMEQAFSRLASEITERSGGTDGLVLVGIRRRGAPMAVRLGERIERSTGKAVAVGSLDITFYRDDLSTIAAKPVLQNSIDFEVDGKKIILVDDVLFTGRTIRAALDALFLQGRPRSVQVCVLIDRGHRELPIDADFVGLMVETTMNEVIEVKLMEIDNAEKVLLMEKPAG
jgi:pyrimidine operon attenuation protein / uracil phosphoribosyltransferase